MQEIDAIVLPPYLHPLVVRSKYASEIETKRSLLDRYEEKRMPRCKHACHQTTIRGEMSSENRGLKQPQMISRSKEGLNAMDFHCDGHKGNEGEKEGCLISAQETLERTRRDSLRGREGYEVIDKIRILTFMIWMDMVLVVLRNPPSYAESNSEGAGD